MLRGSSPARRLGRRVRGPASSGHKSSEPGAAPDARERLAAELQHYVDLTGRVIGQTRRRIFDGESVPAAEKVISIFEEHTDVIRKDYRETYYGHKVCMSAGHHLITDVVVEQGNPADSTLAVRAVERHIAIYGAVPREVAMDGGFAARANLEDIKKLGVENVCFAKRRGLEIEEMVTDTRAFRRLRNFRSGIEAMFSWLKRSFGLRRCPWRGLASFKAYVWASALAANLLAVARLESG